MNLFTNDIRENISINKFTWLLALVCLCSLFLFLDDTLFNTRGEPREAVVALSMLKEGNWVLPINNGIDMAYKPPFFHWLVALCSLPLGYVTEYSARMPSAIALSMMTLAGFRFYARRRGLGLALVSSLILLSNFEVHRAGVACRVDMVLTCMMVLSLYALYRWTERGMKRVPWLAVLCLSGAFLTKGPVGAALPCLVTLIYCWIVGMGLWKPLLRLVGVGVLSCILPVAWYAAAWREGGDKFLHLIYEENVLRLLGKMSYDSHVNPWTYNVMTVVAGFVPYTLLALMMLFVVKWRKWKWNKTSFKAPNHSYWERLRGMDHVRLFSLLSLIIIFVFYCIPKSKRSVYLLPIYPFLAYYMAEGVMWLRRNHCRVLYTFGWTLASIAALLTLTFLALRMGFVPEVLFAKGRHAAENLAMYNALAHTPLTVMGWLAMLLPILSIAFFAKNGRKSPITGMFALVFSIFFALDGLYQPLVLNTKSDLCVAQYVERLAPKGRIYSFRTDFTPGNPLHPFTVNFYLGNRVVPFEAFHPQEGLLLVGNDDIEAFKQRYPTLCIGLVKDFHRRSCDDHKYIKLYHFAPFVSAHE